MPLLQQPVKKSEAVEILNLKVDAITIDTAIDEIIKAARENQSRYIVKPYVEFFDPEYMHVLNHAWLVLADGVALQWAAYFQTTDRSFTALVRTLWDIMFNPNKLKSIIPEKIGGINFTLPLLKACAREKLSVYLVGSPVGTTIEHTKVILEDRIKGLQIIGTCAGRDPETDVFSYELMQYLIADLKRLQPDIILVGLGFPRQELLMEKLIDKVEHGIFIGEGGTFDYDAFGGNRPKAPEMIQEMGLEWLWRLILEPSRVKRQMAIPRFIKQVYKAYRRRP